MASSMSTASQRDKWWRMVVERGIPSEMPALPFVAVYRNGGRAGLLVAAIGDPNQSLVKGYELLAERCDQYAAAHQLSAPLVDDVISRFPWQSGVALESALRKQCIEVHFLSGLRRAFDFPFAAAATLAGLSEADTGTIGGLRWNAASDQFLGSLLRALKAKDPPSSYVQLLRRILTWDWNTRDLSLVREMFVRLTSVEGTQLALLDCPCGCGG